MLVLLKAHFDKLKLILQAILEALWRALNNVFGVRFQTVVDFYGPVVN